MKPSELWGVVKQTVTEWNDDQSSTLAAALSYYTIFSIAPMLIIAVALVGFFFGTHAAQEEIKSQLTGLMGTSGAEIIENMMASASKPGKGLAMVVGIIALLFGASGVFAQLQQSLNVIWKVKAEASNGILQFMRHRFLSFAMVLGIGFLLLVSLVITAALSAMDKVVDNSLPGGAVMGHLANTGVSFLVITLLFAMIYKLLPDTRVDWKDVWLGAGVTSLLFGIGKFAIGLYLGKSSVASSYGAAGSLAIVLLWVYYSSMILFLGAEFTQVYSKRHGSQSWKQSTAKKPGGGPSQPSNWLPPVVQ